MFSIIFSNKQILVDISDLKKRILNESFFINIEKQNLQRDITYFYRQKSFFHEEKVILELNELLRFLLEPSFEKMGYKVYLEDFYCNYNTDSQSMSDIFRSHAERRKRLGLIQGLINQAEEQQKVESQQSYENEKAIIQSQEPKITRFKSLQFKLSTIWIFVLKKSSIVERFRIKNLYNDFCQEKGAVSTLFNLSSDILELLEFEWIKKAKILCSVQEFENICAINEERKPLEFFLHNDRESDGLNQILRKKQELKKVKKISRNIGELIDEAEEDIQNDFESYKGGRNKKVPAFFRLQGEDKAKSTIYRMNLFSGINQPKEQRNECTSQFIQKVLSKPKDANTNQKIRQYSQIQRQFSSKTSQVLETIWLKILRFYVNQGFYYGSVNYQLRTFRSADDFISCASAFNEMYWAIKHYYKKYLEDNDRIIPKKTVYRGTKLKKHDLKSLEDNSFIEIFGFMSTSKSMEKAKGFGSNTEKKNQILFVIEIPEFKATTENEAYSHGFVDINHFYIAEGPYRTEQEILFNALNIYKVKKKEFVKNQLDGQWIHIHLQYAPFYNIRKKASNQITEEQNDLLIHYEYCLGLQKKIKYRGDVFMFQNEPSKAVQYFTKKIDSLKNNTGEKKQLGQLYGRLSDALRQVGQLQKANQALQKALEIEKQLLRLASEKEQKEIALKIFYIHSKHAQISLEDEDYIKAEDSLQEAMNTDFPLDEYDLAVKLYEKAEIKFKLGEVEAAEKKFNQCRQLFKNLLEMVQEKQWEVKKSYWKDYFFKCLCFRSQSIEEMQQRRRNQQDMILLKHKITENQENIQKTMINVNKSLRDVAIYTNQKDKYEEYVKKGKQYIQQSLLSNTDDPFEKAKIKSTQAMMEGYANLAQSQRLLEQAIDLIESVDPLNKVVGDYAALLANSQKANIQKFSDPFVMSEQSQNFEEGLPHVEENKSSYDSESQKQLFQRCKDNYSKAITIMIHHNKPENSKEVMQIRNQLGELNFGQNLFEQSESVIESILRSIVEDQAHTQIAKAYLLRSKISQSKGDIKNSFQTVEESQKALQAALIKNRNQQKYRKIFRTSDVYRQILYQKAKVFFKQQKHDLSLIQIEILEDSIKQKSKNFESHFLFPDLLQLKGQIAFEKGKMKTFDNFYLKSLILRKKQTGKYSCGVAEGYCRYAKTLLNARSYYETERNLENAAQIFVRLPKGHPQLWSIYFHYGCLKSQKNNDQNGAKLLQVSLKIVEDKFDQQHILLKQIRLSYGLALLRCGKIDQSLDQYNKLDKSISLSLSSGGQSQNLSEEDSEVFLLKSSVKNFFVQTAKKLSKKNSKYQKFIQDIDEL